jgi:hypothetical protein
MEPQWAINLATLLRRFFRNFGRGERIRTSGLYVPNVALYQAKLHPDCSADKTQWRAHSVITINRESA